MPEIQERQRRKGKEASESCEEKRVRPGRKKRRNNYNNNNSSCNTTDVPAEDEVGVMLVFICTIFLQSINFRFTP